MPRFLLRLLAAWSGLFIAGQAWAQATVTWTGLAGPLEGDLYAFETAANWQGGVAPVNGDNLVFGAGPSLNLYLSTPFTAGNITFSGITNGNYFAGNTLTLNGHVTTTAGSSYWGLFGQTVVLAAGNHIYNAGGSASIYHFGNVDGAGGITKEGTNALYLTQSGTYSGGTYVNAGTVFAGQSDALGTGTVTLNYGTTLSTAYANGNTVYLRNDFRLGGLVNFGGSSFEGGTLVLGDNGFGNNVKPVTGVTDVQLNLQGDQPLLIEIGLKDGDAPTTYQFSGSGTSNTFYLTGSNSYTGGTLIHDNTVVLFNSAVALPGTGKIGSQGDGYAGLGDNSVSAATFVAALDPVNFHGTLGFDDDNTYAGDINLSAFSDPGVGLGTSSSATLTGVITPVAGAGAYNFRGSGWLRLVDAVSPNPLTGANDLRAASLPDRPSLMVVLRPTGANDFTGDAVADGAGIVIDRASALPESSSIQLANGGYVSVTDTSGLTLADLVGNFGSVSNHGVLGVDSSFFVSNLYGGAFTYADAVNFASLPDPVYLGTTSQATITGAITTAGANSADYYFTGYHGGTLTVDTALTGSKAVHIGLPNVFQDPNDYTAYSNVTLTNAGNTFTGGTVLDSGYLRVTDPGALGSGPVTVDASSSDNSVAFEAPSNSTIANNFALNSGFVYLNGYNATFTGIISGPGGVKINDNMTFAGANTYTGETTVDRSGLIAESNSALGTGGLNLIDGGSVVFASATPQIGSVLQGTTYDDHDGTVISASLVLGDSVATTLTINQTVDGYLDGLVAQGEFTGTLVKAGGGTLTIAGYAGEDNNFITPYGGGTTITGGTLIAGSATALGTGTITLNGGRLGTAPGVTLTNAITFGAGGGTLSGNGTYASALTIGANVILAPGNSPGTMTFTSGLTLAPGGQLNFEVQSALGAAGTGYDLIDVSVGLLDITATAGSPFVIKLISLNAGGTAGNVADFSAGNAYSWMLFEGNSVSGLTGFAANKFTVDLSGFSNGIGAGTFSLTQGVNGANPALFLNFAPVPEPTTYALLALGLGATALAARRRRS